MITYQDIEDAYHRIAPLIVKTPLLTSDRLNDVLGFRLFVKAEPMQRIGAFKFRGACNALLKLPPEAHCVIAFSSGNHAQAVALVAKLTGREATIIMPEDAPKMKIDATRSYGAEVVLYDRYRESREDIGKQLALKKQAVLIKPYDDEDVICGQGTVGYELNQQIKEQNISPHRLYCCAGGGGLISGTAIAVHHHHPDLNIYASEPEFFDDIARSLASGEKCKNDPDARSICDAIITPTPGDITFPIMKQHLAGGVGISDDDCLRAMQSCWRHLKLVVEPGGAVGVASALALKGQDEVKGKDIIAVASGGNVDDDLFAKALSIDGAI